MPNTARITALVAALATMLALAGAAAARPLDAVSSFTYTKNLHPLGVSERPVTPGTFLFNTDLAFRGDLAFQGTYEGFRVIDISAPGNPKELLNFRDCVRGTTTGDQGDLIVWNNLLVRSWNSPAPEGGAFCGNLFTPAGQEGLHIFDISNPRRPVGVAFQPVAGGSHTATAVPDPENGRLLVYNSASSAAREGIDIVQIPLVNPAAANHVRFVPAGRMCHDAAVILGDAMMAACAGHDGFTVWSLGGERGGSLDNPLFLYTRPLSGLSVGHSASFSWDGKYLLFGHEPGGGVAPNCQASTPAPDKSIFFFDAETGVRLGRWVLPRPQTAEENCTIHNFNVVPTSKRHVLVSGNYQSGIAVVDFTDPAHPMEIAHADPAPLVPTQLGGDWSTYWYDGHIYESDITRGLIVWKLSDSAVAGARKLRHLNPQTQETTFPLEHADHEMLTGSFELVGHDPLLARGMNAALAMHGNYAYVGSRTDGKNNNANHAGLLVVDISDPANPHVVNEIGPPRDGLTRESSRELRIWKSQEILIVLHTNCGTGATHWCSPSGTPGSSPVPNNFRFYDISGEFAANPRLIAQLNQDTHEFFLWEDPFNPRRAFMFGGNAGSTLSIWNMAPLLSGLAPTRIFNGSPGYSSVSGRPAGGLHSLSITNDGRFAYYALLNGGFAIADISDFTAGRPSPQRRIVTLNASRPVWAGPGAHSALKFWSRPYAYVSDEVYGSITAAGHGCPWGWGRTIDVTNPQVPTILAHYKVPQNYTFLCPFWEPRPRTSYSAHNPTMTPNIVFTTWHSNGLQAISIEDPTYPYKLAEYMPEPLPAVQLEDPRLSSDPDTGNGEKVVMWSYPIIQDGLVYVVDLRNGFYVLKYKGRYEDEVGEIKFLEGNSNLGNALCYEPVLKPGMTPEDEDAYLIPAYCGHVGGGGGRFGGGGPGPAEAGPNEGGGHDGGH